MERFICNIKKALIFYFRIFSQKKAFLIFLKTEHFPFQQKRKEEKNPPQENLLHFRKWKPRKNINISGNGTFLYFTR